MEEHITHYYARRLHSILTQRC